MPQKLLWPGCDTLNYLQTNIHELSNNEKKKKIQGVLLLIYAVLELT